MTTFKQLLALKPRIMMANNAPSEWGRLDWVEVQRNPAVSRIFLARGQRFLISPPATSASPNRRYWWVGRSRQKPRKRYSST